MLVCSILAAVCGVQATYTSYSIQRCDCNGRSRYCLRDAWGLRCVDCQGNTEGRHCERCKDGFHQQGAEPGCTPCRCNISGSVSATCDSRGRCSCKEGVTGQKCDRCPEGPIGPDGCTRRRQHREDSGSCFCYGHSSRCRAESGFSVFNITSTFSNGLDDWKVATLQGVTPGNVHFRWSPKHQDLEVISSNSLPIYLYAPDRYLGNQLLSYGQNLSFWLRLDRGVRHPSIYDVILEGRGLQVSASLGDLRSIVPCGQKLRYSFRLDERPGSRWRPHLSPFQFQTLLQNLTAIKIRATFGENSRGYLDDVQLASAHRGRGVPAPWVQTCTCPPGYEGDFCERCSVGFGRSRPADGPFSPCEACDCRGGGCDPFTRDCYSADETSPESSCSEGFYRDPLPPQACVKCPCPDGRSCSLPTGSFQPQCDRCPTGTTGPQCDVCLEGFYREAVRGDGFPQPCRRCQCNGHIDVNVAGSCDRRDGRCLRCLNNTRGRSCEDCLPGFYHRRAGDACKPCDCDGPGSESDQCDGSGRCRCKPGFEGLRCERSNCPACFDPVKEKVEVYAARVQDLETQLSHMDGGSSPSNSKAMEAELRAAQELVTELKDNAEQIRELEKTLQSRLSSISRGQLSEEQDIQKIADAADDIQQRQQTYRTTAGRVETLIKDMRRKLDEAKSSLRAADVPVGDAPAGPNVLWSLAQTAQSLANRHQAKADAVEQTANEALSASDKSLALVRSLMNTENEVTELTGDLKTRYDQTSARVKTLENQATRLSAEAKDQSKMADDLLKDMLNMERNIPSSLKGDVDAMAAKLRGLTEAVDGNLTGLETLQNAVQDHKTTTEDLLTKGKGAQKELDKLVDRVNAAKTQTEDALKRINSNTDDLDNVLDTLGVFDQQIDSGRALADAAIRRLPNINATIQQVHDNNADTTSILEDVAREYGKAVQTVSQLEDVMNHLEGNISSLAPHAGLLNEATKLNQESQRLRTEAAGSASDLKSHVDQAQEEEAQAQEAAAGAAAALENAQETREAVGRTLRDVSHLLANMNRSGVVDHRHLKELEDSVVEAQKEVERRLRPRLTLMEEQETAQRRRLEAINQDMDAILRDIANLEDILKAVPPGCFNSPPIEEA